LAMSIILFLRKNLYGPIKKRNREIYEVQNHAVVWAGGTASTGGGAGGGAGGGTAFLTGFFLTTFFLTTFFLTAFFFGKSHILLLLLGFLEFSQKSNLKGRPYTKCAVEKFKEFVSILMNDAQSYRISTSYWTSGYPQDSIG